MAPALGKRKRRDRIADAVDDVGGSSYDNTTMEDKLQVILKQHFEVNFEPIEGLVPPKIIPGAIKESRSDPETESDWDGLSDEDDDNVTEVVHYSTPRSAKIDGPQEDLRTFMTAKPPPSDSKNASTFKKKLPESTDLEEGNDAANLKKDLALQRLLRESHLLDSSSSLSCAGQNRHKALDLRLQGMGSKSSIFVQNKMPLAQRKGIVAKATERGELRKRQAQENGIVLESAVKGKSQDSGKRQRGIGAPSVGKFQGGMLKISKKDVAEIEGPKKSLRGRR